MVNLLQFLGVLELNFDEAVSSNVAETAFILRDQYGKLLMARGTILPLSSDEKLARLWLVLKMAVLLPTTTTLN